MLIGPRAFQSQTRTNFILLGDWLRLKRSSQMSDLKEVKLGNGSIEFVPKFEGRPASTETTGNVTINNSEIKGIQAHYTVSSFINSTYETDGIEFSNMFHWNCVVLEPSDHAAYRSVEDRAVRQIAPMLRALADKIEAELPDLET
jgi:hypothetical protein